LRVEYLDHDCLNRDDHLDTVTQPDRRRRATRGGAPLRRSPVLALMQYPICSIRPESGPAFDIATSGLTIAQLLGRDPAEYAASQTTYDLRRLRLHELIERIPRSHKYPSPRSVRAPRCSTSGSMPRRPAGRVNSQHQPDPREATNTERLDAALAKFFRKGTTCA